MWSGGLRGGGGFLISIPSGVQNFMRAVTSGVGFKELGGVITLNACF